MTDQQSHSSSHWLVRIGTDFEGYACDIFALAGAEPISRPGGEYHLVRVPDPAVLRQPAISAYLRWNLPVEHAWPCNPEKMTGFVEKAAQAMAGKFAARRPQAMLVGQIDPADPRRYYKALASNLRGRALQLFPQEIAAANDAEAQDPERETLFCLVGKRGLFCGMHRPRLANGFYPGGTKFIAQEAPETVSRAGAKLAGALHHLRLHRQPPPAGSHWLELGASPGGMTSELLRRDFRVTAIDRAPLDPRVASRSGLTFARLDAAAFRPNSGMIYDAILCDMNGSATTSITEVARLSANLQPGGIIIFTVKTAGAATFAETNDLLSRVLEIATTAGLRNIATTHLAYNRAEFTLFFERAG